MASNPLESSTASAAEVWTRRYWRRREDGPEPWSPAGWLPLLGLILLFAFAAFRTAPAIEAQTQERVHNALTNYGAENLVVDVNGQEVSVTASGNAGYGAQLKAVAVDTACSTWIAGEQICPNTVQVTTTGGVAELPAPADRYHNITLKEMGNSLTLRGEVPDELTRANLVATAERRYASVVDQLTVTNERPREAFDWAVDRALPLLVSVEDATVNWQDGVLSAAGRVGSIDADTIRGGFANTAYPDRLGELSLAAAVNVASCNERFANTLAATQIQFATGSANIAPASGALLDSLATLAQECPIALVVEGHTDNVGNADFNQRLSLDRARAVVEALNTRGIATEQLTARGYGAERPIASNDTAEGRAGNRRIEILAVENVAN